MNASDSSLQATPPDDPWLGDDENTPIPQDISPLASAVRDRDRVYLIVIAGNLTGQMFRLDQDETFLGRSSQCEICLRDNEISREHACIRQDEGGALLLDLGSTNGTYVNGKPIKRHHLRDGDRIQLGRSSILKYAVQDELEEMFQLEMYHNTIRDGLTQVHNRKYFDERLADEFSFACRHHTLLSLLMLDIDHFKEVNDQYGHPVGDRVLQRVATAIRETLRQEDLLARYGGEEFAILCRGIYPEQAQVLAERVRKVVGDLQHSVGKDAYETFPAFTWNEDVVWQESKQIQVTVSLGVVTMSPSHLFDTPVELVHQADQLLLQAKEQGRNQVVVQKKGEGR